MQVYICPDPALDKKRPRGAANQQQMKHSRCQKENGSKTMVIQRLDASIKIEESRRGVEGREPLAGSVQGRRHGFSRKAGGGQG